MKMNRKLLMGLSILTILGLLLVGCGGKKAKTAPQQPTPTPAEIRTPTPAETKAPAPQEVTVPVNLKGARNVGSLQIELVYNSAVLEAKEVKAGELAKNAMIEYNMKTPGRLTVGIVDAVGINGSGSVATVLFKIIDKGGTSPITLEKIEANDATSLIDIPTKASAGSFVARDQSFTAPVISLSP